MLPGSKGAPGGSHDRGGVRAGRDIVAAEKLHSSYSRISFDTVANMTHLTRMRRGAGHAGVLARDVRKHVGGKREKNR